MRHLRAGRHSTCYNATKRQFRLWVTFHAMCHRRKKKPIAHDIDVCRLYIEFCQLKRLKKKSIQPNIILGLQKSIIKCDLFRMLSRYSILALIYGLGQAHWKQCKWWKTMKMMKKWQKSNSKSRFFLDEWICYFAMMKIFVIITSRVWLEHYVDIFPT